MRRITERGGDDWLHVQLSPATDCPLCKFLGAVGTPQRYSDSISHADLISEDWNRRSVRCFQECPDPQVTFNPCAFLLNRLGRGDGRMLLPIAGNDIECQPELGFSPLRSDCVDFDLFEAWITDCEQNHGLGCCGTMDEAAKGWPEFLPGLKVLDCTVDEVVFCPPKARYVALSYVWGQNEGQEERDSSLVPAKMTASVPISRLHLPRTIQDAMEVVTKLGFRYLWVDKYCIDQTDPVEMRTQISAMDRIYRNATVTVIAAAGPNSAYGLPGVRPDSRLPQPRLVINGTTFVSLPRYPNGEVTSSVWNQRGWTLQEGYFARRRLIFTEELVMFQCERTCLSEFSKLAPDVGTIPIGSYLLNGFGPAVSSPGGVEQILNKTHEYSTRKLSYQSDAINAIQGILSSYAAMDLSDLADGMEAARFVHFWGLPITLAPYRSFFASEIDAEAKRMVQTSTQTQQFQIALSLGCSWSGFNVMRRDGFPSWSWAGWRGTCFWYYEPKLSYLNEDLSIRIWVYTNSGIREGLDGHFISKLIGAQSHDATPYTMRLSIETTLIQLKLSPFVSGVYFADVDLSINIEALPKTDLASLPKHCKVGKLVWQVRFTPNKPDGDDLHTESTQTFECAVMFGHYGLILRTRDGVSERIGMVRSLDAGYENPEMKYNEAREMDKDLPHRIRCLKNHFPTRSGRILLE
jgi:hypothetical protein